MMTDKANKVACGHGSNSQRGPAVLCVTDPFLGINIHIPRDPLSGA
jgi:hypothetical protein